MCPRRSLAVREKRRLQMIDEAGRLPAGAPLSASVAALPGGRERMPRRFRDVERDTELDEHTDAASGAAKRTGSAVCGSGNGNGAAEASNERDHLPPASAALDTYTLLKVWGVGFFFTLVKCLTLRGLSCAHLREYGNGWRQEGGGASSVWERVGERGRLGGSTPPNKRGCREVSRREDAAMLWTARGAGAFWRHCGCSLTDSMPPPPLT
eukprot:352265-Chlamydomonas_euryale.AAC.3